MSKTKQISWIMLISFSIIMSVPSDVFAMHIMEGYLQLSHCIGWFFVCIPFLVLGFKSLNKIVSDHKKTIILLAMIGAYAFVLSALKIPSVTGSSSHPTGTGLGAILFGPSVMSVIGLIVLLFQAILLAHGGLTTLGANTFSMAIAGPFLSYGIYKLCSKLKVNRRFGIFLAASLGNLFTYCVTSFQLALAHPAETGGFIESFYKFLGVFAVTQVPLAIIEGILTVVIIIGFETYAKPELKELKYFQKEAA